MEARPLTEIKKNKNMSELRFAELPKNKNRSELRFAKLKKRLAKDPSESTSSKPSQLLQMTCQVPIQSGVFGREPCTRFLFPLDFVAIRLSC
jgi:hypothetical protein